jgi:hypothetical protein
MSNSKRHHFYVKRQQFIDEILFDHGGAPPEGHWLFPSASNRSVPALTAFERNVAIMIAKSESPDTGETFESYSSIAKRLGRKTKVRQVENAAKVLEARGWLQIEQRSGRTYLSIRVKGLHGHRSTKLPDKSYETRQRQIGAALECGELSHAERQAYIGLLSICDAAGIWHEGQREAACYLGMPQKTFNRAMQCLAKHRLMYISDILMPLPIVTVAERDGKLVEEPLPNGNPQATGGAFSPQPFENKCTASSNATHLPEHPEVSNARAKGEQEVSKGESDFPAKSTGSAPTPLTLVTPVTPVPYPADTDRVAAQRGRAIPPRGVKFADEGTLQLWQRLYEFLTGDYAKHDDSGEPWHTMGGIVHVSEIYPWTDQDLGDGIAARDVQHFVRVGLLARDGKRITITEFGHAAAEHGYVDDEDLQQEAA